MFDKWVDQVDEWKRQHELTEYTVIATMGFLLTDDAKDWFKTHVRDKESQWTLKELNSALFDEQFPADVDMTLHEMWKAAEQGAHSLRQWHKYLTKLYERVPNLSLHDLRRRFMEGANGWLREKWAEEGFKPEDPKLKVAFLLEIGQRFEQAREIHAKTRSQTVSKSREMDAPTSENTDIRDPLGQNEHHSGPESQEKGRGHPQRQGQDGSKRRDAQGPSGGRPNLKGPSAKEKAELWAKDRCFECGQQGHMQRNCSKRREMTPTHKSRAEKPMVYNASLRFEVTKMKKGGMAIRLNMIEPLAADGEVASERRQREEGEKAHHMNERMESIGLIWRVLYTYLA
jgi:hypothetical protein